MAHSLKMIFFVTLAFSVGLVTLGHCADCSPSRPCLPDRPVPPETVGGFSIPFDIPIWPTIIKTEFHIMPWICLSKVSVCLPGSCKSIEFRFPSLSLKPIPVWIPWLMPLDVECKKPEVCRTQ